MDKATVLSRNLSETPVSKKLQAARNTSWKVPSETLLWGVSEFTSGNEYKVDQKHQQPRFHGLCMQRCWSDTLDPISLEARQENQWQTRRFITKTGVVDGDITHRGRTSPQGKSRRRDTTDLFAAQKSGNDKRQWSEKKRSRPWSGTSYSLAQGCFEKWSLRRRRCHRLYRHEIWMSMEEGFECAFCGHALGRVSLGERGRG